MAGHSKWANIKHRKEAQDNKKGKIFTKIARELTVAAKIGGGDPASNSRLRLALDKARASNMPKDNVERAVKKGTGEGNDQIFEDITYEGYAPGGVGILFMLWVLKPDWILMVVKIVAVTRWKIWLRSTSWQQDLKRM